jgi:tetratricopeptide (TPR) repeat protein
MNRCEHRAGSEEAQSIVGGAGTTTASLYEAGLAHMAAGRFLDAQVCCQQALAADSNNPDALHLMGLLAFQAGQLDHAIAWIGRAIRQNPKPDYLANLGSALRQAGRLEEALQVFDKAIQLKPDDPLLWCRLAGILAALGRNAEALLGYQHALKLDPHHWEAAYHCGELLFGSERFEEALSHFHRCNAAQPDHVRTLQARARCLSALKRFDECFAENARAHALDPADPISCNNAGNALLDLGRPDEALRWFDKALALRPNSEEILRNKGAALTRLRRFDDAIAIYERAIAADPTDRNSAWNLAVLQLLTGNLEAGFRGHEALRVWRLPDTASATFSAPKWLGHEPLVGKTIAVWQDEGHGDTIQFARYIPLLAARGARVILVVEPPLNSLLSRLDGVSLCLSKSPETRLPPVDFHAPIYSLPAAFGTRLDSIPSGEPYLPVPAADQAQAFENRFGPHDKFRVGLVWSGRPTHPGDLSRSIPFRMLTSLLDVDATFVSLQKDPRPLDAEALQERPEVIDFTADLTDLAATAALISRLDLVIAVDTAVAHLAAALGRPTWIMLPYTPDFRWLLGRDDSPWYPAVRLFRQNASREYGNVIARVRSELQAMIAHRHNAGPGKLEAVP